MRIAPLSFLQSISGFARSESNSSADRPVKIGVVDPAYDPFVSYPSAPPPAKVTFDGEFSMSGKAYQPVGGYIPWPGARVYLLPMGSTYVIAGPVSAQTPQGFWSNSTGTESGTEFGAGTYFSSDEGLVVAHDLAVAGDFTLAGGKSLGQGVINVASANTNSASYGTTLTAVATMNVTIKAGRAYRITHGAGVQHTAVSTADVRLIRTTGTTETLWEFFRYPVPTAGVIIACQGEGYICHNGLSNVSTTLQIHMATSTGTGFHAGGTSRRRYMTFEDIGKAADWPMATAITP